MSQQKSEHQRVIEKQFYRLAKEEAKLLRPPKSNFVQEKFAPTRQKIEEKIPEKLEQTLCSAFEKGFALIFEKGSAYIEKCCSSAKLQKRYHLNEQTLLQDFSSKNIKKVKATSRGRILFNKSISTASGAVLGVLGIGLPDIPIIISMILKTVYEIALNYGFDYQSDQERVYILHLIAAAVTTDRQPNLYYNAATQMGYAMDKGEPVSEDMQSAITATAKELSDSMLTAKFIQGIPLVGTIGSVVNYQIIRKVSKVASIQYQKRFLNGQLMACGTVKEPKLLLSTSVEEK